MNFVCLWTEISSGMSRREDKGKSVQYADETKGKGKKSEEEPILSKKMDEWGKIRLFDERTQEFVDDERTKLRIERDDSSPRVSQTNDGRIFRVRTSRFHKLGTSERDLEFANQMVQPDVANYKNRPGPRPKSAPQLDKIPPISWTLPFVASGITKPDDFQTGLDVHAPQESNKLSDDSVERVTHEKKTRRRQGTPRYINKLDYELSLQLGPPKSKPKNEVPSLNPLQPVGMTAVPDERRIARPYDYQTENFIDTQALLPRIEEVGGYQANLWNTPVYQQSIPHPGQAFLAGHDLRHFHQGQQGFYQGTPLPPPESHFHGQFSSVSGYQNQGQEGKYEDTPQPAPQNQSPGQYTHYPYYPGPPGPPGSGYQQ